MTTTVKRNARRRVSSTSPRALVTFLKHTHPAVRSQFAGVVELSRFLQTTAGALSAVERRLLVEQALVLFEQNYVHLPLKRAMYAVDPVQRLRLLLQRLLRTRAATLPPEMEFHREMQEIFASVRDLHTIYALPAPFAGHVAFLPFMIEDYFEGDKRKYLVSHVMHGFNHPSFVKGVEVRYWNGVPIGRAVMANGERYAGGNLEARLAHGVETLTTRPLATTLPPDEEWVVIGYQTLDRRAAELCASWLVMAPNSSPPDTGENASAKSTLGLDFELDLVHRARKPMFAPAVVEAESRMRKQGTIGASGTRAPVKMRGSTEDRDVPSNLPSVVEAKKIPTSHGTFGYLRIRSFVVQDDAFIAEVIRLLALLPENGLILDVRENGGGNLYASERLLQLFTPRRVQPEPTQFINTPLNLRLCRRHAKDEFESLGPWIPSMEQALQTGAAFSAAVPLTSAALCNSHGQVYIGPVVLITDALCYSATDSFAAGFQDHDIGLILGTDGNTGAGGANVWTHEYLRELAATPTADRQSPYRPLANGAGMRVAIRRTLRVGARSGTPLEDLGVVPDRRHYMTRDDLLRGNVDLIEKAASLLARRPVRKLDIAITSRTSSAVSLGIATHGLTRLDLYLDERPERSVKVSNGQTAVVIAASSPAAKTLRVEGFKAEALVVSRRVAIG